MRVCIYVKGRKLWAFCSPKPTRAFFIIFGENVRVPVVGKRTSHVSSLCVLCVFASLCLVVDSSLFIFFEELKWIKNRIFLSSIASPKIQARGHFLTNQISIITYLFWSLNIFSFN